jgi:hypothetical protein
VSYNLYNKQQKAKENMALLTSKCSTFKPNNDMFKHAFDDLSYNTSNSLIAQYTPILSNSQIGFILLAPPFWRLQIDRPASIPQTVGYGAFIMLY